MRLPDSLRNHMKAPLGVLLPQGSDGIEEIQRHLPDGAYIITVGDMTTEKMINLGIVPSLQIVDGLEQRKARRAPPNCPAQSRLPLTIPQQRSPTRASMPSRRHLPCSPRSGCSSTARRISW